MPATTPTPHRADLNHVLILDRESLELSDHPIAVPWCIEIRQEALIVTVLAIAIHFRCRIILAAPSDALRLLPKVATIPRPSQEDVRKLFEGAR